ncbi:MAG TPA: carboxypeptidase regulatory-like domain-containing protein [Gemmatimonadaceae bacterium]|nr:carboxypeptidase regulatory-like domain-containing protein [Gemmatimonadaceae bacterium]
MRSSIVMLAIVLVAAVPADAAAQRSVLLVGVGDAETGAFVEGAEVIVKGVGRRARTDAMGQARIPALPAGQHVVEVRRIGYAPLTAPVLLAERDSTDMVMMVMPEANRLPAVEVTTRPASGHLAEFEALRKDGQGRFVSVLETAGDRDYTFESFLLAHMPGMRLQQLQGHTTVMMIRGSACQPLVYLDGVMLGDGDVSGLGTRSLGAVAFFESGQIPPRYRRGGTGGPGLQNPMKYDGPPKQGNEGEKHRSPGGDPGCGALVMWSR